MIIDYLKDLNNKDKQLKAQQFTENYFKGQGLIFKKNYGKSILVGNW